MTALAHLEDTSGRMLESIEETIKLIQVNMDKVSNVNKSVTDITKDATSLGENIQVVDSAVKEVENSNKTLVDNMKQVCDIMEVMTGSINDAEETTKTMLSKYAESARSAINIETVVGQLMEELGVGGFMGVHDVREGMKIAVVLENASDGGKEYLGEVAENKEKELFIILEDKGQEIVGRKDKHETCQLRVVVDNVLYSWKEVPIRLAKTGEKGTYVLAVESNPQVFNRRKYPRMPLKNLCTINFKGSDTLYDAKMVNISANGFAFAARNELFADCRGKDVIVDIKDFAVYGVKKLEGCIIRSSDNDGEYIVGCRMPQDSEAIREYVSQNYSE